MAKFTFGAGNARAILRAPFYVAGSLASRLVARDPRLWVFGSGIGPGEGALALYELASRELPTKRLVWLCSTDEEVARARRAGLKAVRKDGWRGFRLTLRARVAVVTHGLGDVNRYAATGAFVVQLWHGIPLKKLHLDSPAALRLRPLPDHPLIRRLLSVLYRRAGRRIDLFPAASELSAGRLRTAFGIGPDVLTVTGDPRNDVLHTGTATERRTTARAVLEEALGPLPPTVVLYAPTWRDGAPDPSIPTADQWRMIADWLERNDAAMLVRSHPLGVGDYAPGVSARVLLVDASTLPEIMPALPAVDVLVTDYSSIAYDYSLTGGPIVFFAPDLGRYESSRGLYEPYRDFSGDTHVSDWAAVLALAETAPTDPTLLAHSGRLRDEHFDLDHGGATGRVLQRILEGIGEVPRQGTKAPVRARLVIDRLRLDGDRLLLGGPDVEAPASMRLVGQRVTLPGTVTSGDDGWTAEFPLHVSQWGAPPLAPPSGAYRITVRADAASTARFSIVGRLPAPLTTTLFRITVTDAGGAIDVIFDAPLTERERADQGALERHYRRRHVEPENSVFFESFYGQVVACNPRAIDARLAAECPDLVRYWSTVDASVAVPDGAVRVVEGSAEWWDARAKAKLLIVNDWLRKRYVKRARQTVLQTWHGTMLKRLALDRAGIGIRTKVAVLRERARWDVMLAQNPHSTEHFRSAYRFRGPIWEVGYPRDDALVNGDGGAAIRDRLGIARDARVVMYAPTWRDDRAEIVDFLDLPALALDLGDDTVTLVRGHSRTLRHGRNIVGERLLDVTSYPDVADLLLVADVLVTDYSSLMFDFTATGRPVVFFTPDLRHYGDELRGFSFDLLADAPGPVTQTQAELLAALASVESDAPAYAERYARWRRRFNPHDDGRAADRVVRRILDEGLLD